MCLENSFHSFSTATVKVDRENGSKLNPTALMGKTIGVQDTQNLYVIRKQASPWTGSFTVKKIFLV